MNVRYQFVTVEEMIFQENQAEWRKCRILLVKRRHFMYGIKWNEFLNDKSVIFAMRNAIILEKSR